jgi:hypothetical protein
VQWSPCAGANGSTCAAGYECFGTRGVFTCEKICDTTVVGACPAGLSCDPLYMGSNDGICE